MTPYLERRGSSIAGVIIGILIPLTVWWACLSTDSLAFAWGCAVVTAAGVWTLMFRRASEAVRVTGSAFHVGNAHLEGRWIGHIESYSSSEWKDVVRAGGGHRVWLSDRSFHPGGVRIEVTDPDDPVGSWLVSSRNSLALAEALHELVQANGISEDRNPSDG